MHFPEFPSLITHICIFKLSLGEPEKSTAAVNIKHTVRRTHLRACDCAYNFNWYLGSTQAYSESPARFLVEISSSAIATYGVYLGIAST